MEDQNKNYDAMKLPIVNNAIPGTFPRSWLRTRIERKVDLLVLGLVTAVAVPFGYIDHSYQKQAQEIHLLYTTRAVQHERKDDEMPARLSVYEELNALRQEDLTTKSWAVDLFKKIGKDFYVTQEGFERRR